MSALELTTINQSGDANIDFIPGQVSTGYQAQNTISQASRSGLDTINLSFTLGSTNTVTLGAGGVIEENGNLFTLKQDLQFSLSPDISYCFSLKQGSSSVERDIVMLEKSSSVITWSSIKNGWYTDTGFRVLNSEIFSQYNFVTISQIGKKQLNTNVRTIFDGDKRSSLVFSDIDFIRNCSLQSKFISYNHGIMVPVDDPELQYCGISSNLNSILYLCSVNSRLEIAQIDYSDSSRRSWNPPYNPGNIVGLSYLSGTSLAVATMNDGNKITIYSSFNGLQTGQFLSPGTHLSAIAYYDNDLWSIDGDNSQTSVMATLYRHNGVSSFIKHSYSLNNTYYCDLTISNGILYAMRNRNYLTGRLIPWIQYVDIYYLTDYGIVFVKTITELSNKMIGITCSDFINDGHNNVNLISLNGLGFVVR